MKFLGLQITRQKRQISQVPGGGGWSSIMEPFTGAWQKNVEWKAESVLAYSTVNSCITLISNDIAKLGLKLVKRDAGGIWTEIEDSKYSPLLAKPNRIQNRVQFYQHWVSSKLAHGNVYALKERDQRGNIVALHILDPMRVRVMVSDIGEVFYQLDQDFLSGLRMESVTVPASEIIHDRMNTLHHPLVGTSPIYACGLAATQGLRIQNNSAAFFGNGARPSGILSAPGEIKSETAQRLKETWETNYSGANTGKVAVLGDGLAYQPMMMSAVDAQMIETLKWTAQTVADCFHVPFYKVGGPPPSYNNIQALNTQYYSDCLQVLIESIELCLDEGLELPARHGTEFDLDDLLRMDTKTMAEAEAILTGAGIKGPNEARRHFNLGPVLGGDTPYLQVQNYSLAALAERDAQGPLLAAPEAPTPPEADPTERMVAALQMKIAEALHA